MPAIARVYDFINRMRRLCKDLNQKSIREVARDVASGADQSDRSDLSCFAATRARPPSCERYMGGGWSCCSGTFDGPFLRSGKASVKRPRPCAWLQVGLFRCGQHVFSFYAKACYLGCSSGSRDAHGCVSPAAGRLADVAIGAVAFIMLRSGGLRIPRCIENWDGHMLCPWCC